MLAASKSAAITQKHQYSQPAKNPAQPPSAVRARSANEPVDGWRSASRDIRITRMTGTPVMTQVMNAPGTVVLSTTLEPRNSHAR